MASLDSAALSILKDKIYQMIALNPATIKCRSLHETFASDDNMKTQVDALLTGLADEKKIVREGSHGFRAVRPWADIAYVVIGKMPEKKTASIPVQILNMPALPDVSVTMSRAEFNRHPLKEGDRIVAGLVRGAKGQAELRARMISPARPWNAAGSSGAGHAGEGPAPVILPGFVCDGSLASGVGEPAGGGIGGS
jgi:hypothetical protein